MSSCRGFDFRRETSNVWPDLKTIRSDYITLETFNQANSMDDNLRYTNYITLVKIDIQSQSVKFNSKTLKLYSSFELYYYIKSRKSSTNSNCANLKWISSASIWKPFSEIIARTHTYYFHRHSGIIMTEIEDQLNTQIHLANRIIHYKATALKTPEDKRKADWTKTILEGLENQWKLFFEADLKLQRYADDDAYKAHGYLRKMGTTGPSWSIIVQRTTSWTPSIRDVTSLQSNRINHMPTQQWSLQLTEIHFR